MKRVVKFRGKRTDTDKWSYGNIFQDNGIDYLFNSVDGDKPYFLERFWTPVRQETIGQYTGLRDINGKDIYEGDILFGIGYQGWYSVVEWNDSVGAFTLSISNGILGTNALGNWLNEDMISVVGNIHDHPHLIPYKEKLN